MGFELLPPMNFDVLPGLAAANPGADIEAAQQQRIAQQQAAQDRAKQIAQQKAASLALHTALTNPNPTTYAAALALNPNLLEQLKAGHSALDEEAQRQALNDSAAIHGNLAVANDTSLPDAQRATGLAAAKAAIQQHITAEKASGQDTSQDEAALAEMDQPGGAQAVQGMFGMKLAGVLDKDRAAAVLGTPATVETARANRVTEAETARHNRADENKPVLVGKDQVLVDPNAPAQPVAAQPSAAAAPVPTGGVYDQIGAAAAAKGADSDEQAYLRQLGYVESRGKQNAKNGSSTGYFQFHPTTFTGALGRNGNINDLGDQTEAALNLYRQDKVSLQHAGIAPTSANAYILHQQGAGGGLALLTAPPEVNAIAALTPIYRNEKIARQAIVNNGGTPNMTAGQFVNMWQSKWGGQTPAQAATSAPATQSGARVIFDNRTPDDPNDPSNQPPDPDTVKLQAGIYLGKGTLPPLGMGKYAAQWKTAILKEATDQAKALGLNANDIIAGTVSIKAAGSALQQLEKNLQALKGSEGTILANADLALSLAPKGAGTTGVPIFNAWQQHVRDQAFGDPDVSRFNVALKTVADEYARAMTANPSGSGGSGTSDRAANEAYSRLATSATPEQLAGNIDIMKREIGNQLAAKQAVHDGIQAAIRGGYGAGGSASPTPTAPAPAAAPSPAASTVPAGTMGIGPNGHTPIFSPAQYKAAAANPANRGHHFYDTNGNLRTFP